MKHALSIVLVASLFAIPACDAAKSSPGSALSRVDAAPPAPPSTAASDAIAAGLASPRFRVVDNFMLPAIAPAIDDFVLSEALSGGTDGRWVALHFLLKTDCPLCLTYTMRFHELSATQPNVKHVFIKPDDDRISKRWVKTARVFAKDLPTIHRDPDAALAKQLDVRFGHRFHGETVHYPCLILIDPRGHERYRYTGTSTFERATVDAFTAAYQRSVRD